MTADRNPVTGRFTPAGMAAKTWGWSPRRATAAPEAAPASIGRAPDAGKSLDFIVFGVARSGTTALAGSLNLDPAVFCAGEVMNDVTTADHATLELPATFLDTGHPILNRRKSLASARQLQAKLAAGPIRLYGNKQPPYYLRLDTVAAQVPGLRALCIHRGPAEIARSWDARAADPRDKWPESKTGDVAVAEWFLLLARLAETRQPVTLIDYGSYFFGDAALFATALAAVGAAPPSAGLRRAFRREFFRGEAGRRPPAMAAGARGALLAAIDTPAIEGAVARHAIGPATALAPLFSDWVQAHGPAVFAHLAATAAVAGTPDAARKARSWATTLFRTWDLREGWTWPLLLRGAAQVLEAVESVDPGGDRRPLRDLAGLLRAAPGAGAAKTVQRLQALQRGARKAPEDGSKRVPSGADGAAAAAPRRNLKAAFEKMAFAKHALAQKDHPTALHLAAEALALSPGNPRFEQFLRSVQIAAAPPGEDLAILERAIAKAPDDPMPHLQLSRRLIKLDRDQEARAAAARAAALDPANGKVRQWLLQLDRRGSRPRA